MSEDTNTKNADSLIDQVNGELKKAEREAVKAKLKEILKKRLEAEKTIKALDLEADKLVKDFTNGVS